MGKKEEEMERIEKELKGVREDEIEESFEEAVKLVQSLPKGGGGEGSFQLSNEQKLAFYSLYKQATSGPCSSPAPSFYQIEARAKWFLPSPPPISSLPSSPPSNFPPLLLILLFTLLTSFLLFLLYLR